MPAQYTRIIIIQYESKYLLREVLQTLNTTCTFSCEVTMVP